MIDGFFKCDFCGAEAPEGQHVCGDRWTIDQKLRDSKRERFLDHDSDPYSVFGMARIKREGAPVHPEEITMYCDIPDCPHCRAFLRKLGLAWLADQRKHGVSEEELKREDFYEPPQQP